MNAHNFVAEHGIEAVKHAIEEANAYGGDWIDTKTLEIKKHIPSSDSVFIGELKQVVESLKLVEIHGYEKSKEIVKNAPSDDHFYSWKLGNSGVYDKTVNIGELKQAIADYELVESLKSEVINETH